MIEGSPFLLALAAGALALLILTYRPWRWLVCGHPFGSNPATHRLERCHRKPFHRGPHLHPSTPLVGYTRSQPERCGAGHVHADLGDAVACAFGDRLPDIDEAEFVHAAVMHAQDETFGKTALQHVHATLEEAHACSSDADVYTETPGYMPMASGRLIHKFPLPQRETER